MTITVTIKALRCIDDAGGFDNYIINTHERTLDSKLAIDLKKLMLHVLKCKEEGVEMNQIREEVFPKPPPNRHIYVPKVYMDRFYFDWKGLANKWFFVKNGLKKLCLKSTASYRHTRGQSLNRPFSLGRFVVPLQAM